MIQSVEIKGLRGIREGDLTGLTPLVVLVGPNGSGKSTVLESALIGGSPTPVDAIIEVVRRHEAGGHGPRWLLWRAGRKGPSHTKVTSNADTWQTCGLTIDQARPEIDTLIQFTISRKDGRNRTGQVFWRNAKLEGRPHPDYVPLQEINEVRLVEAYPTEFQKPIDNLYTKAVEQGRRNDAIGIVTEVFPEVTNVEILTENGKPILHFVFADYSVPATLCGDGIQSLLRLSLELAASGGGVALLEEPEVHQHPGAIRQSAKAIIAAVRRNIQVILTTHSLELIDALVTESLDKDLEQMSLYRLVLQDGILKHSRVNGPDIAFQRTTVEVDLR